MTKNSICKVALLSAGISVFQYASIPINSVFPGVSIGKAHAEANTNSLEDKLIEYINTKQIDKIGEVFRINQDYINQYDMSGVNNAFFTSIKNNKIDNVIHVLNNLHRIEGVRDSMVSYVRNKILLHLISNNDIVQIKYFMTNVSMLKTIEVFDYVNLLNSSALNGNNDIVRYILEKNKDVITRFRDTEYPVSPFDAIEFAVIGGDRDILNELLNKFPIYVGDKTLEKNFILSIYKNDISKIKELLDLGVSADTENSFKWSALAIASSLGEVDIVKLLLKYKANANYEFNFVEAIRKIEATHISNRDFEGITYNPFLIAIKNGQVGVAEVLYANNDDKFPHCERNPLTMAVSCNKVQSIKFLLEHDANSGEGDEYDPEPLMTAVETGDINLVKLLLERTPDIDARFKDKTALTVAAENSFTDIVEELKKARERYAKKLIDDEKQKLIEVANEKKNKEKAATLEKKTRLYQNETWRMLSRSVISKKSGLIEKYFNQLSLDRLNQAMDDSSTLLDSSIDASKGKLLLINARFESDAPNGVIAFPRKYGGFNDERIYISGVKANSFIHGEEFSIFGTISGIYKYRTVLGSTNNVTSIKMNWKLPKGWINY